MKPPDVIAWPVTDPRYTHTGEGGMYAMAVIPLPADTDRAMACCVCTYTYITRPDVCVSPERTEVWPKEKDWSDASGDALHAARTKLEAAGDKGTADALSELIGYDDLSVPVLASVFLGSTGASLWDERDGAYFTATEAALTPQGHALCDALAAAHGTRPLLLTFLDT